MPGVIKVVRDGSYLAVVAEREFQAIKAMRALAAAAQWQKADATLPAQADLFAHLTGLPAHDIPVLDKRTPAAGAAKTLTARYTRPYLMHGSIGPSCAVAQLQDGTHDGLDAHPGRVPGPPRASPRCWPCRTRRCAASMSRAPAATATTAPTTSPPTPR